MAIKDRIVIKQDGTRLIARVEGSPGFVWADSEDEAMSRVRKWSWDQHRRMQVQGVTYGKDTD